MDALLKSVEDFKAANDKRLKEIETKGFETSETKSVVEKANAEIERLNLEVKKIQTAMNRSGTGSESASENPALGEYKKAFVKYIRTGNDNGLKELQVKALSSGSDPDGGFFVLPEMATEIVKKVFESSPMRQAASVQAISSNTFEIIQDLDEVDAGWVDEYSARPETDTMQFKKIVIGCHEIYAQPKMSQHILDDAFVNVESLLAEKVAEKFARKESTAHIVGDGVNQPKGILSYTAGTGFDQIEQVISGAAAAITANGIIDLVTALNGAYRAGAAFMMKRVTVGSLRKLVDLQGQYLWQPALTAGNPDLLMGYPIIEADDFAVEGAGNLVAAFGNFKAGYQIVDRLGIRTLRDNLTAKPYILFYSLRRTGGAVKNFEAIKLLKCSA